jgi:hypothetical protein
MTIEITETARAENNAELVVLLSTWVDRVYRNQRVASERIARNPSYGNVIDPVHPGDGAGAARPGR